MIFARFEGPLKEDEHLTVGKVYICVDGGDEDIVFQDVITVQDDNGTKNNIDKERFSFPKEVYAVVVVPFDDFVGGDVVELEDVYKEADNKVYCKVRGYGYREVEDFVIIDRTNLYPGIVLRDKNDGAWKRVVKVDECMWITTESFSKLEAPLNFQFAIVDGDILVEPLVTCIDDTGAPEITHGKHYSLVYSQGGLVDVRADNGEYRRFSKDRFKWGG